MKAILKVMTLAIVFALAGQAVLAQQSGDGETKKKSGGFYENIFGQDAKAKKSAAKGSTASSSSQAERLEPDDTTALPTDVPAEAQAHRRGMISEEEAAIVPYYNNFMTTYHLGPEDVISVTVFGQERYSRSGITVPPHGRISYPLVGTIFVSGKTTEQVEEELIKKLDEYIIDPKISVSLDKAASARYSVLGDVGTPGVKTITRRLSVYEAIAEAGGVLNTGDKSKVFILRRQPDGNLAPIPVNIKDIERGRAKEMAFIVPGDQIIVPGNKLKTFKSIMDLMSIVSFARLFTGGW